MDVGIWLWLYPLVKVRKIPSRSKRGCIPPVRQLRLLKERVVWTDLLTEVCLQSGGVDGTGKLS